MRHFIIFIFPLNFLLCQNYSVYYSRLFYGEYLLDQGKNDSAQILFDSLSSNFRYSSQASYYSAIFQFKNKNYKKAVKYLLKLSLSGIEYSSISDDCILNNGFCISVSDLNILNKHLPKFKSKYNNNIDKIKLRYNSELNEELKIVITKDQFARETWNLKEDSDCFKEINNERNKLINRTDSLNLLTLKFLLYKNKKIPDLNDISPSCLRGFGLIIAHNSTSEWCFNFCDSILSRIKDNFKNGNSLGPEFYANVIDRRYHKLKKQNYYLKFYDRDLPILDPQNVNMRRKEIFLMPINDKP